MASRVWTTGAGGQGCDEPPAVTLGAQSGIQNRQEPSVLPVTDEPAEALLKRQNRQRHLIFAKGLAVTGPNRVDPGGRDRVARRRER